MVNGHVALPGDGVYTEELVNFFGTQSELMRSAQVQTRAAARVEATHPELTRDTGIDKCESTTSNLVFSVEGNGQPARIHERIPRRVYGGVCQVQAGDPNGRI